MNQIYFIHVQTNDKHENESIFYLSRFLNKLSKSAILIIIENGIYIGKEKKTYENLTIFKLKGSNDYNEFSGYEEGKNFIINNYKINLNDIFIFSNDTFYRHRYFFGIMQRRFLYSFRKYCSYNNFLIGYLDKNTLNNFYIENIKFTSHISTFFFISNYNTLKNYNFVYYNKKTTILNFNNKFLSINGEVNDYTSNIYNFLFKISRDSWYNEINFEDIHKSNINYEKKIYSILNEHYLSIYLKKNNLKIISIFPQKKYNIINIYKSLEDRIVYILKKLSILKYLR
jgi:hypothetical protein